MKMKRHNKLAQLARTLWPGSHRRYQEICVLAITGQLGGPEMSELDQHIAHCEACRSFLESTAQAMSMLADGRVPKAEIIPPVGIRARFLSRAAAEGLNIHSNVTYLSSLPAPKPFQLSSSEIRIAEPRAVNQPRQTQFELLAFTIRTLAVAATILLVVGLAGYYGGRRRGLHEGFTLPSAEGNAPYDRSKIRSEAVGANDVAELEQRKTELESESRNLTEKLADETAQKKALEDDLSASTEKLADATAKAGEDQRRANQEKLDAKNKISSLQEELDKLRWQLIASEAELTAQQNESEDLKSKLEGAESDLQRASDLKSASAQIGDLVAARNLHIIDVYDADKGERQHSFGRVFYVEGKSLVFYVYDLDDPHRLTTNVVFRVWGEQSGIKETTHSLGILHNDNSSKDRWALTFDDAKVLAQINSVFVTVEPANRHSDKPRGKKVLYAYFGSTPNHP
jgi:predicted  nucleic acid-binding Zn-ribbon protein